MSRFLRLPTKDPRTIARDIPGISHILFPQLTSGLVASLNKTITSCCEIDRVDEDLIKKSKLRASVLFELGYVIAEEIIKDEPIDYVNCFARAVERQKRYYDYVPQEEENLDIEIKIASEVSTNLVKVLRWISNRKNNDVIIAPYIYGYEWISNSQGDFSVGSSLIEVKCSHKNFSILDYRQILIYFLLDYIKSINFSTEVTYKNLILINPRLNKIVEFNADDLLFEVSAGRSKIETVQLFSTIIKARHNDFFI